MSSPRWRFDHQSVEINCRDLAGNEHVTTAGATAVLARTLWHGVSPRAPRPDFILANALGLKACHCMCIRNVEPVVALFTTFDTTLAWGRPV